MHKLWWFYPENDLALAANTSNYTAPAAARAIGDAGRALPLWYADDDDYVLCYGVNAQWLDRITTDFHLSTHLYNHAWEGQLPCPWGWSMSAWQTFFKEGMPPSVLPPLQQIATIRNLSHRRTGAQVARVISQSLPNIPFTSPAIECSNEAELKAAVKTLDYAFVAKTPWSSSGRGVVNSKMTGSDKALRFATDSILKNGSVMIEPAHNKVAEFALLYDCYYGDCHSIGTSVFATDAAGHYTGNLLADEATRIHSLSRHIDPLILETVREHMRQALSSLIAQDYTGLLGVDMLITDNGILDPVVEINLRTTMGHVANRIADRHIAPGAIGQFQVKPLRLGETIEDDYLTDGNRHLSAGTLLLTPSNPRFAFMATIGEPRLQ